MKINFNDYKKSYYIKKTDVKISNKYFLIYSSISTKLFAIDEKVYKNFEKEYFEKIPIETFNTLLRDNFIVKREKNELVEILNENEDEIKEDNYTLYQAISPSLNCQLGCGYCGQVHINKNFNEINEIKILERIEYNLAKKSYKNLTVSWFGGEPLMGLKSIRNLTKKLKEICFNSKITYRAKIVTNGLSLKEVIFRELLHDLNIDEFEITLDGIAEHHDKRRHTKSNEKTFELILNNLKSIINSEFFKKLNVKPLIKIRTNIDKVNANDVSKLVELLEENKILEFVKFYMAPIHSWGNDADMNGLTMEEFAEIELENNLNLVKKGKIIQFIPGARTNIVCMSLKENAELFDANGNLFNCSEVSQVPKYENDNNKHSLGNYLTDDFKTLDSIERPFKNWNNEIFEIDLPCKSCKILPICGGHCPKLWKEGVVACPSMKYNFEDRMLAQFYLNNKENFI
jgi:uncharacterized protein